MKITIDYICNACGGREVLDQDVDVPDYALEVRLGHWRGFGQGIAIGILFGAVVTVLPVLAFVR